MEMSETIHLASIYCIAKMPCRGFGAAFLNYISLYILLRDFATVNHFFKNPAVFYCGLHTICPPGK